MKKLIYTLASILIITSCIYAQSGWILQTSGTTENLYAISCVDSMIAFAAGGNGTILYTTNKGDLWSNKISGTSEPLLGVDFIDANNGIAVGWNGIIIRTTNGGINWTTIANGGVSRLDYVIFINQSILVAVGGEGTILRSTNGGLNWFSQYSTTTLGLCGVHFIDVNIGTAVGWNATIVRTTNGGNTWVSQNNPLTGTFLDLWGVFFTNANTGIVSGENGTIFRTTNGGSNWITINFTGDNRLDNYGLWDVYFGDAQTGMIVGDSINGHGILLKTTNGGITWAKQSDNSTPSLNGICMVGAKNAFAIGYNGKILHTSTGGEPIGIKPISNEVPDIYNLSQNYPNPFNPVTKIKFEIPKNNYVTLKIYDALGQEAATLVNEKLAPGTYEIDWNGSNYPSGVYFYRLIVRQAGSTTGDFTETRKMILIK